MACTTKKRCLTKTFLVSDTLKKDSFSLRQRGVSIDMLVNKIAQAIIAAYERIAPTVRKKRREKRVSKPSNTPEEFSGDGDGHIDQRSKLLDDEKHEQLAHARTRAESGHVLDNLFRGVV